MTCSHCITLAAELAELRQAVGLCGVSGAEKAVRDAFRLSPMNARIVLRLYAGVGGPVTKQALEQECHAGTGPDALKVHIHQIRCGAIGSHGIETLARYGYRLSLDARARVHAVLQPLAVAA